MNLIEQLEAATQKLVETDQDTLVEIARAIAFGKPFDEMEAAKVLRNSGKTPSDLESLVAQVKDRIRLKAIVDARPAKAGELAEVKAEIEAEGVEFRKLMDAHDAKLRPLIAKQNELESAIEAARSAERRLHKFVIDQSLVRRKEELAERRSGPARSLKQCEFGLGVNNEGTPAYAHARAEERVAQLEQVVVQKTIDGNEETLALAQRDLRQAQTDLAEKDEVLSRLRARRVELLQDFKALDDEQEALWLEELNP